MAKLDSLKKVIFIQLFILVMLLEKSEKNVKDISFPNNACLESDMGEYLKIESNTKY